MAEDEAGVGQAGLAAVLQTRRSELLRFLVTRCGDPVEAEDLLQELWLKTATISTGPIANGRAYLFRMANNLVVDRARARRRAMHRERAWLDRDGPIGDDAADPGQDFGVGADARLIEAEEARQLSRAIEALPPGARRALILYRFDGRAQGEIARIMGISVSGVEKHLALAMKSLRRNLDDCGFFGPAPSEGHQSAESATRNRNSRG